jgi:hypothetical protein
MFNNGKLSKNDAATLESYDVGHNSALYCSVLR